MHLFDTHFSPFARKGSLSGNALRILMMQVLSLAAVSLVFNVAAPALVAQDPANESPSSEAEDTTSGSEELPDSEEPPDNDDTPATAWTEMLIDGTLAGWVQFGGNASFTIQRNEIVGTIRPGIDDSFLCTESEYADFELELECKIDIGLNSGIQIRSQIDRETPRPQVYGYQVEIDSSSRAWTGSLYDQSRAGWLATTEDNRAAREAFNLGQWNQIRVVAIGSRIRTEVNGVPAIDFSEATDRTGFIALQIHRTDVTDSLEVRWRRLRIRVRD